MRIDYPDNGFMLSWEKARAWYYPNGALKDCEYKRIRKGFPVAVAVSAKHKKTLAYLTKQGKQEFDLLERGILKRKIPITKEAN